MGAEGPETVPAGGPLVSRTAHLTSGSLGSIVRDSEKPMPGHNVKRQGDDA